MDLSTASDIVTETAGGAQGARAAVEIGPYDLPEPPGGWVDLALDLDADEEHAAVPVAAPGAQSDVGRTPPAAPGSLRQGRVETSSAHTERPWFLVPEALVVAAFVLFGVAFAVALSLLRGLPASRSPGAFHLAPVEVTDPAPTAAWRRHARFGMMPAASRVGPKLPIATGADDRGTAPPGILPTADPAAPMGVESPLDPEAPPPPSLAPFSG